MLLDLSDVSSVGPKMAIALITTFYGTVLASLIFIPITVKLKRRSATEALDMSLILEGLGFIRKGVNPRFMQDVLENYLDTYNGKAKEKKGDDKGKKPAKAKGKK